MSHKEKIVTNTDLETDANRDPLTGAPGAHPGRTRLAPASVPHSVVPPQARLQEQ